MTTTNLAEFGFRELAIAGELLTALAHNGCPEDFNMDGVTVMFNRNSGCVFLTNSDYQVAMLCDGKLESFYSSPYEGKEGFFDDFLEEFADMHHEDQEWFADLAESLGRSDELPTKEEE